MADIHAPTQEIIDQFVGNAHGNFTLVKELLAKYPSLINSNASWTETAIQAAAQTGQVEIANYLLEHGAEYDICTAAMLGSLDCVNDFLLEDPSLVNAQGAHGIPLLYFPVIRGRKKVADYLLSQGADPQATSPDGLTPLHGAVIFNQPDMVLWLFEQGVNPNPKYDGKTPLELALENEQEGLVEILRAHGGASK
jgi:ankyrin repeat protein